jgi:hypothetical protein
VVEFKREVYRLALEELEKYLPPVRPPRTRHPYLHPARLHAGRP